MLYRAYDIMDVVVPRPELTQEQTDNIELVVNTILKNLAVNQIYYQVPNERISDLNHPIINYRTNVFSKKNITKNAITKEIDYLANKLLFEEQIEEDGKRRRNKKIKEGLLFVKHTSNQLLLLKFEDIKIIDRTTFQPIEGLSIDGQYYKIAIIKKDELKNITVVDKNKKIAKYWASGFLELERQRDSYVNTVDLLNLLEANELINPKIDFTEGEAKKIEFQIKDFIFNNENFDKEDIFSSLKYNHKKHILDSDELFSDRMHNLLDSEFPLNSDAIIERYRRTIKVSKGVRVRVDNLYKQIKRDLIEIKNNKLILTIDKDFKENVHKVIEEAKNG